METFSACHVSTGPTDMALVGTSEMLPPPDVRAFWAMVSGCRSTTRVVSFRHSAGEGGLSLYFPVRLGGSLKAQCFTSPCPPCMTAHRTPLDHVLRYAAVSAFGKCRFASGIAKSFRMRLKHISRSAFSNESGCVGGASLPSRYHTSIPQKCPDRKSTRLNSSHSQISY